MAREGRDQGVRDADAVALASGARPDPPVEASGVGGLIQKVLALRAVRVFLHYNADNGPLIANGMTYQAVFALAAGLWFVFSVAGFVLRDDPQLRDAVFAGINSFIPGLIGEGDGSIVKPDDLLNSSGLTLSSAVSLVGLLFTAVGFLGTLRTAIRIMFDLPAPTSNPVLLKLKDLGLTAAFIPVVLLTTVISVVSNTVLDAVLGLLGLGDASTLQQVGTSAVTFAVLVLIDGALLAAAFRILSGLHVPLRRLLAGAALGGFLLGILQTAGGALLGNGTSNPIFSAFATLIGLFLYLNLACQFTLIAASWIAVGMADVRADANDLPPAERLRQRAERIEDARQLVAVANRQALEQRVRESRGLRRWRLIRQLSREVREEAQRQQQVPTVSQYRAAQEATANPAPDSRQVEQVAARVAGDAAEDDRST